MTSWKDYLRTQVTINFVLNFLINGLIAYFSFRQRGNVPFAEMAIDALITLFIIGFLVSWLAVIVLRGELVKDKVHTQGWRPGAWAKIRLPANAALRALLITLAVMLLFGGLLSGLFWLFLPNGSSGITYFVIKAFYAGLCAFLAAAAAIASVLNDEVQNPQSWPIPYSGDVQ